MSQEVPWKGKEFADFEKALAAYPDIPSTILVKLEALSKGVKLTPATLKALKGVHTTTRAQPAFSFAFTDVERDIPEGMETPYLFCLKKDDAVAICRPNQGSPYTIGFMDGKFFFCDERLGSQPIEEVYFPTEVKSLSKVLPDGTPYRRVLWQRAIDGVFFDDLYFCEFWRSGDECRFCDRGSYLKLSKKMGVPVQTVSPESAAKVIKDVFDNEPQIRHLAISSGTILDAEKEIDFHCRYLEALTEAFDRAWYPCWFQIVAREEKHWKRIRDTGYTGGLDLNMEVWDDRMFNIMCPGKAKLIGKEEWIRRAIEGVNIFGRGNILINFVAGVEMAQPWGFKDAKSAVESTLQGCNFLMEHDVLPRFDVWCVEHGSALRGHPPPPLEYYVELAIGFQELLEKHNFHFPSPGRCRACSSVEVTGDMWHYFHKENPPRR